MSNLATQLEAFDGDVARALEDVAFPAYVTDRDGRIRGMNGAALELFGDVRGKLVASVVAPSERAAVQERLSRKLIGVDGATENTVEAIDAQGRIVVVEGSVAPLHDAANHIVGLFGLLRKTELTPVHVPDVQLTPREAEVLSHLVAGCSTAQMAELMGIAPNTVRNHVKRLLRALGVHSRLEAVALARRAD
jgi:PAS domain S-box-containing protein